MAFSNKLSVINILATYTLCDDAEPKSLNRVGQIEFLSHMKKLLFLAVISSFLATSCKKYSDGGLVSKADKRLSAHTWKLDKYLRNGNDETSQLLISNFTENFAENGTITRFYTDSNGDFFSESGSWTFDNDKMQIKLTGVGSI